MDLAERVEAIVGQRVLAVDEIPGAGGYTPALRRIATLADGSTVFVKAAVDEMTRDWLGSEQRSYEALDGHGFLPRYFGCDGEVLVIEDLRHAHWPPPWRQGDIERTFAVLADIAATAPPTGCYDLSEVGSKTLRNWASIAAAPEPLLGLGVCSRSWLDDALPRLIETEAAASLEGDALVHFDARSDNLCLLEDRVLLIDWNSAARGNDAFDRICLAQSITLEGGPPPEAMAPAADPGVVAMIAGYFADRAPMPVIATAPRVRDIQLAQLRVTLPWVARLLDLPPPA